MPRSNASCSISSSNTTTVVVIPTVAPCTSAGAVSTITPTATATTLTGSLTTTDCKLSDGSFYVKVYKLTVAATATIQIDLSSTRFDTFLYLLDSGLAKIDANDDAFQPQNTDSRISRSLAPGTYFIGVNSYRNGATGAYTLTVKTVP